MQFLIFLLLSAAVGLLRFHFGKVAPSAFGTYEALAHILIGLLIMAAIQFGRPLRINPFLWLLILITAVEVIFFLV